MIHILFKHIIIIITIIIISSYNGWLFTEKRPCKISSLSLCCGADSNRVSEKKNPEDFCTNWQALVIFF